MLLRLAQVNWLSALTELLPVLAMDRMVLRSMSTYVKSPCFSWVCCVKLSGRACKFTFWRYPLCRWGVGHWRRLQTLAHRPGTLVFYAHQKLVLEKMLSDFPASVSIHTRG